MYCSKCGAEIGNARFCPNCGEPMAAPNASGDVPPYPTYPQYEQPIHQKGRHQPKPFKPLHGGSLALGIIAMISGLFTIFSFVFIIPALALSITGITIGANGTRSSYYNTKPGMVLSIIAIFIPGVFLALLEVV